MLAIFNRNRDAFQGENINRLRSGTELDMPGVDDVLALDRADAERRVREHMRSWQPAAAEDVATVTDAAMPEFAAPQPDGASGDASAERAEEETAAATDDDGDFRLDVVPPEDDEYSESSAVAEGEIQRVSDQLAEVEEAILAEDLDDPAFDEHVEEVRDALERRDMAGLAVAEESLAELEARLREAREARAEQERLAQSDGGEQATDSEEGDQIADYLSELEEEFGAGEGDAADPDADEAISEADGAADDGEQGAADTDAADAASPDEQAAGEQADELAAGEDAARGTDEAGAEADDQQEAQRPMTVTRTSSSTLMDWLWPALGLVLVILVGVAAVIWLRRRREDGGRSEPTLGGGDAVDSARASVARNPDDLAAHLALLRVLADEGREQEFTDAFDQMYQEVDDESAPEWQEALSLASAHVPDHPLLTPRESSLDEDEDFDRRADEMFGMLDVDESESAKSRRDRNPASRKPTRRSSISGRKMKRLSARHRAKAIATRPSRAAKTPSTRTWILPSCPNAWTIRPGSRVAIIRWTKTGTMLILTRSRKSTSTAARNCPMPSRIRTLRMKKKLTKCWVNQKRCPRTLGLDLSPMRKTQIP